MIANDLSYQSSSILPVKLLYDEEFFHIVKTKQKIIPRVMQLIPTNRCNLKCKYCCCENIDRNLEMSYEMFQEIAELLIYYKIPSVVLSGGGEPFMHPRIDDFINDLHSAGIKIGSSTNGTMFASIPEHVLAKLDWCRISCDDYRNISTYEKSVKYALKIKNVNWSFSYVYSFGNIENLVEVINLAYDNDLSHIRLVSDRYKEKEIGDIRTVIDLLARQNLIPREYINRISILQKRDYTEGYKKCFISLLKPRIGAGGELYPCCAIPYQNNEYTRMYPKYAEMGTYKDLPRLIEEQKFFDGSICKRCNYGGYNFLLEKYLLYSKIKNKEFL